MCSQPRCLGDTPRISRPEQGRPAPDFVPARPYPVCRQKLLTGYAGVRGLEKDPGFVLTTTCPRSTIMARLQLSRLLTISRRAWSAWSSRCNVPSFAGKFALLLELMESCLPASIEKSNRRKRRRRENDASHSHSILLVAVGAAPPTIYRLQDGSEIQAVLQSWQHLGSIR